MNHFARITLLLAVGGALVSTGGWLAWRQAPGQGRPEHAVAKIAGLWLRAPDGSVDVLATQFVQYRLERSDGGSATLEFSARRLTRGSGDAKLDAFFEGLVGRDLAEHRRALRLLGREGGWERLAVDEAVGGWFDLTQPPSGWLALADGTVAPANTTATPVLQRTSVVLALERNAVSGRTSDTVLSYERKRHGQPTQPPRRDLAAYADGYETSRWPLAWFVVDKAAFVASGEVGRRGSPHALFAWFEEVEVRFTRVEPARARLVARVPAPPGEITLWLRWFSRASEAVLYRWAYPLVLLGLGSGILTVAFVLLSLGMRPPHRDRRA